MTQTVKYSRDNYKFVLELSEEEYKEVMEVKNTIAEKKKELSQLLQMYEKLCPGRVHKTPLCIDADELLG